MHCPKCGKQLNEEAAFCTECGLRLNQSQQEEPAEQPEQAVPQATVNDGNTTENGLLAKINDYIEKHRAETLNKYFSAVSIAAVVALRLLGLWVSALLIAAVNGYLIYRSYKATAKIDAKMCAWTIGAFLICLIMHI